MHVQRATRAMSALVLAVGLALVAVPVMAAAPSPDWTKQFGSTERDGAIAVAVDKTNAVYVVGSTSGTITGWPSRGGQDAFVRKLTPDGKKAWTKQFGTAEHDGARAVAVDRSGNVYVVGRTNGSLSRTVKGSGDAFVRKFKPNGMKVWTKQFGSIASDTAVSVAVDRSGNIYVVGDTSGSMKGTPKGSNDVFLCKFKPNGVKAWTRQFGTTGNDYGRGVAVDRSGHVYVTGMTYGSMSGPLKGNSDAFLRKFKPNGTGVWIRQFGSDSDDDARGVAVGPDGRIVVAGTTAGSLSGSHNGGPDAFLRKYKPDGTGVWTRQFGTDRNDYVVSVAIDRLGRVAVVGRTDGLLAPTPSGGTDALVRKYKSNGDHAWTSQFGTTDTDRLDAVAVDSKLRIVVAGSTDGSITGWPSRGVTDAFVRKYKR